MEQNPIVKVYEPKGVEDSVYKKWEESGFFNPDKLPGNRKDAFTISMPPPNATGILHIGHASMLALQDLAIRYQRMQGKKTLWLPGTDHAAIATQTKVEKLIKEKEGKSRHDLGREEFLKRVREFVAGSQSTIRSQIRKMGSSCDWSRERYTLDDGLTRAVQYAFVQMYNDGLIYRGNRIVNWCPHCQSTLADDEVEYKEGKTPFYYFKYGPVVIGTARPETKFGDKVIIVHPKDKRYQDLIGKEFEVEWILGKIKAQIIADEAADMEMGSGAMTITPAHSFVDFELAKKYNLAIEKVINEEGKMTTAAGKFAGLPVREARQRVIEILEKKKLIDHIDENYVHNLSVCYRCGTPIEPLPSRQWFLDVNQPIKKFGGSTIKDRALAVVRSGEIEIIPERFKKVYYHWLENLRDWCVSRQIWFGHRIPVWYKEISNPKIQNSILGQKPQAEEVYVGIEPPKGDGWVQDPDTLDTWFSSGLWTFSTLGWPAAVKTTAGKPQKTGDLKTFHPTNLMETGYDILFFWVARMIIMSTYFLDEIPFEKVYLHGLVRDEQGRKMSKSLDNAIDPLDVIAKFGADATRLSLIIGTTPGNDMNLSEAKIGGYRNFVNKLWNISRYILMSVKSVKLVEKPPVAKTLADKWILAELDELIDHTTKNLEKYNFSLAGEHIYEFTWSKLADWYVEISKIKSQNSKITEEILLYILQVLLKLWHPFTPFVTEVIWQKISPRSILMIQPWPVSKARASAKVIKDFELIKNIISVIRNLRAESSLPASKNLAAVIISGKYAKLISQEAEIIKTLARLEDLTVLAKGKKPVGSLSGVVAGAEIYLPVSGMIDITKETSRLTVEAARVEEFIVHLEQKLQNQKFLERAPKDIIENERKKLTENKENLGKIKQQLKSLK